MFSVAYRMLGSVTEAEDVVQDAFLRLYTTAPNGGRVPAGLWARIIQRLLALNTAIWHNWLIGAPVKRSLIAYDHVSP